MLQKSVNFQRNMFYLCHWKSYAVFIWHKQKAVDSDGKKNEISPIN